eukprot:TRINITY_DN10031_c0_g1_i1.p1 TRINITY_DN10031_c0_g1~~TRINITY_DN10031_c0_g1_i1.p1  ORF type:complete len:131 (+),score=27.90 TRINITY_DN10031_c0_g1_i1:39-395(+)
MSEEEPPVAVNYGDVIPISVGVHRAKHFFIFPDGVVIKQEGGTHKRPARDGPTRGSANMIIIHPELGTEEFSLESSSAPKNNADGVKQKRIYRYSSHTTFGYHIQLSAVGMVVTPHID